MVEEQDDQLLMQMMAEEWEFAKEDKWSDYDKVSVYWLGKNDRFRMPNSQRVWMITGKDSPSKVYATSQGNDIILSESTLVYPVT